MVDTLENSFHVPSNLLRKLRDYLKNRSLLYETLEGQRRMEITAGVAQVSILGPDFWNASYDSLLRLDMPEESRLVGYADDVAALVVGRTVEQAQSRLGILMGRVSGWITAHEFSLTLEKTEVIILTKRRIPTLRHISIGESTIDGQGCSWGRRLESANGECWRPYSYYETSPYGSNAVGSALWRGGIG